MRILASRESGAARGVTLALVLVFAALVGIAVFLGGRGKGKAPLVKDAAGPVELSRTNLVLEEGRLRQPGSPTSFTGIMVEHYMDGTLRSRSVISNGVLHGLSQGWFTNGQMQVSEVFKEGVSHGQRTKWYADGVKQSEAGIADGKIHGTFRKWHPNGTMSEQAEFVADKPEGTSTSWYPSGYLKARVTLRDGKPVEQTFWKDGEKKE